MLDYKDIITKRYALGMSGSEIARQLNASKSGVNDFLVRLCRKRLVADASASLRVIYLPLCRNQILVCSYVPLYS